MQILLVNLCGFCVGVDCVISIVENVLVIYGVLIYVCYEVVYNCYVVDSLCECGVIFIEQISEVLDGVILIFFVYGVFQVVCNEVKSCDLMVFDVICLLVIKVYMEVVCVSCCGEEFIFIGYVGYLEVEGIMGQYSNLEGGMYLVELLDDVWKLMVKNEEKFFFMIQIMLLVDDMFDVIDVLCKCFLKIVGLCKDDICYVMINCQEVVCVLVEQVEVVLVVGLKNFFNFNCLVELVQCMGKCVFLIDDVKDIQEEWVKEVKCVGVIVGVLVLDILVQNVVVCLQQLGGGEVILLEGCEENIVFEVLKELCVDICEVD